LKEQHEKKLTEHNQRIENFEEILLDFQVRHPIFDFQKDDVFKNRETYAGYFILAVVEMLKYAVKEDYES
jgi:ABC-type Fe3+-citrate transport system substrate-binding protein